MKHYYLFVLLIAFSYHSFAGGFQQDTVFNQTDSKDMKQGYWKKFYPNGNLMYRGLFKDDKPVGEMKRYFESGNLKATLIFDEKSDYAAARIYYEDGTLASDGFYSGSKKDSTWNYYSYYDGKLKSRESYKEGMKDGFSLQYYPGGSLFDKTEWRNDLKDGIWEQYFEDGSVSLRATYKDGKLTGDFNVYYSNGHAMIKGFYSNDKREGSWTYYNENGSMNQEVSYTDGHPKNKEELTEQQQEFFRKIEKNLGKYRDPDPAEFFPQNGYSGNEY
jgi:antitoxin component YwqK of YwqJK toxin-antitoxin module